MRSDEPLHDPAKLALEAVSETRRRNEQLDQELAPMHCVKSFVEWMNKKATSSGGTLRTPACLRRVIRLRREQDEQAPEASEEALPISRTEMNN